jgi:hypothetical protein
MLLQPVQTARQVQNLLPVPVLVQIVKTATGLMKNQKPARLIAAQVIGAPAV